MSAHEKAPTTAKQTGAFKTNLSLNFNRAIRTYNAIISIANRHSLEAVVLLIFLEGVALGALLGGAK